MLIVADDIGPRHTFGTIFSPTMWNSKIAWTPGAGIRTALIKSQ